jgi:hypothetical protein
MTDGGTREVRSGDAQRQRAAEDDEKVRLSSVSQSAISL